MVVQQQLGSAAPFAARGLRAGLRRVWDAYLHALEARPVATKCVSSAVFLAAGDAIAQGTEARREARGAASRLGETGPSGQGSGGNWWDAARAARFAAFGALIHGPCMHLWFRTLEHWVYPQDGPTRMRGPVVKLMLDKAVLTPFLLVGFYAFMEIAQGRPERIASEIEDKLIPTALASWAFWSPLMLFVYWKVPVQHRLLSVNLISIAWNAGLSMMSGIEDLSGLVGMRAHEDGEGAITADNDDSDAVAAGDDDDDTTDKDDDVSMQPPSRSLLGRAFWAESASAQAAGAAHEA